MGMYSALRNPIVSVIIPARNEEASLASCLTSLVQQNDISFEIIVVDDGSTDKTREIAQSFDGVRIIQPPPLPPCWTGKNNAVFEGAKAAKGEWLLFTDADTVHRPGSLARAVDETSSQGADLLSYSPEQEVHGFWEMAVMPVIFAELASTYRPSDVSDPASPAAAANGQYILVSREAYCAVGGHAAVASDLLEDVALARRMKTSGRKIVFRYGGDAVRTRMYRSFAQLHEGWTKNLVLLFPSPMLLASLRFLEFAVILIGIAVSLLLSLSGSALLSTAVAIVAGLLWFLLIRRISKAHFSWQSNALALFGLPLFSYLLLRSKLAYAAGKVSWKGREYDSAASSLPESTDDNLERPVVNVCLQVQGRPVQRG